MLMHLTVQNRFKTAAMAADLENIFIPYLGKEVTSFRTDIARSRRGGAVEENRFSMRIELVNADKREKSLKELKKEWNQKIKQLKGFKEIKISKGRFGQSSGSAVEIKIQDNNYTARTEAAELVSSRLAGLDCIYESEVEKPLMEKEYHLDINGEAINRLDVSESSLVTVLTTALNGVNVFDIKSDDEEIEVNVILPEINTDSIEKVLSLTVNNRSGYPVPLYSLINYREVRMANSVEREDSIRTLKVYGDLSDNTDITPLQIADILETEVFPDVQTQYPSVSISFDGEIADSRESGNDIVYSVTAVLLLIYIVLALLFNSLYKPF